MPSQKTLEIFLVTLPGFENHLCDEAKENGFRAPKAQKGGVRIEGNWPDVWRANLVLRGASKVLVRLGSFAALHLAQLDKRAQKFPWGDFLPQTGTFRVETSCKKSKIYHQKAASQRLEAAIEKTTKLSASPDSDLVIKARIFENICTLSLDSSGEGLHKRGHKQALNKAPMRETICALTLRHCGFQGTEPVLDPMCGSGTFILEAGEMAKRLLPGRARSFAFETLPHFQEEAFQEMKQRVPVQMTEQRFFGFDRDQGAIERSQQNALRAGLESTCHFERAALSNITPPQKDGGLVVINPPYGVRIGDRKKLYPLYQTMGQILKERFSGWRIGLVAHSPDLVKTTQLPFEQDPLSFSHGGIPVKIYRTKSLA